MKLNSELIPLKIQATGRGNRQMCKMDKYGIPLTNSKDHTKNYFSFQTDDIVKTVVPVGYKIPQGTYILLIAVRKQVYFRLKSIQHKQNKKTQRFLTVFVENYILRMDKPIITNKI